MSSDECLRHLISERLTAAAEEIFRAFQATIIKYEEEIVRQSRLLDLVLKPDVQLRTTDLPQQHVSKDEEVLIVQQLCNQERNPSLDQEEPAPPQIKEEQEELYTSPEGELDQEEPAPPQIKEEQKELYTSPEAEQLVLKQENETLMLIPTTEERDISVDQSMDLSPDKTLSAVGKEHVVMMSVRSFVKSEPNGDNTLLFHSSHVVERQDCKKGRQEDSGSTRNTEKGPQKRLYKSKNHTNNEDIVITSNSHSETYTGEKCFKCGICGKSFKYKSKLKTHMRVHTGEKPYNCTTCKKEFSLIENLKKHMRIHTGEKLYSCYTCGKRFSLLDTLKKHMRTHTGEKPYQCKACEKRFSELGTLKVHMRTHTGEKPYQCNACEKRFSHLGTLKVHMRTHTGEKPYPCSTCEKRFSDLGSLKVHMRTHTGEKAYQCNTCKNRFSELSTLKVHMRIHTGEKPYQCNICEERFSQLCLLKVHVKTHR